MEPESKFEIQPLNETKTIVVAISCSIYKAIVESGNFVLMNDHPNRNEPAKLASLWTSGTGSPVILIWEMDADGIYRPKVDINLMLDGTVSIEKKVKDGSTRRTDVKIVY